MNKALFDAFENNDNCVEHKEESTEKAEILEGLAKHLSGADICYLLSKWMELHDEHSFVARAYDESTGDKLLHFRMEAQFGYYLDALEEGENV